MKINQQGFGGFEVILVFATFTLVVLAGWLIWPRQNNKSTDAIHSSTQGNYVNVIQEHDTVKNVTPEEIAKTSDQSKILQALHESCDDSSQSNVTVNGAVFDDDIGFSQDGNYATINASRCDPAFKTLSEIEGSGASTFLHKNDTGSWTYDFASQDSLSCEQVDGKGYPASLIPNCIDGSNGSSRAPQSPYPPA